MKRKRMSLTLAIVFFMTAVLIGAGVSQIASAAEPQKVIGKLTVPAGTEIVGLMMVGNTSAPFVFIAFDEQVLYVLERLETSVTEEGEVIEAGYLLDLNGFRHTCPAHGLEVMDTIAMGGMSDSRIATEGFKLELF